MLPLSSHELWSRWFRGLVFLVSYIPLTLTFFYCLLHRLPGEGFDRHLISGWVLQGFSLCIMSDWVSYSLLLQEEAKWLCVFLLTGSHCAAMASLELSGSGWTRSPLLCILGVWVKGICYHAQPKNVTIFKWLFIFILPFFKFFPNTQILGHTWQWRQQNLYCDFFFQNVSLNIFTLPHNPLFLF